VALGEICNRVVVFGRRHETVTAAAQLMREHHVGDLVVVDDRDGRRVPCGILTDRDIVVGVVAKGLDPDALTIGEVVGSELVIARESDSVSETIERMRAKGVRRIPVVDTAGSLAGIVTADDLLDLLAEELGGLARIVVRERGREVDYRR
jgi:CBS domain-containing protein